MASNDNSASPSTRAVYSEYRRSSSPSPEDYAAVDQILEDISNSPDRFVDVCCTSNTHVGQLIGLARAYSEVPVDVLPPDALVKIFLWHLSADKVPSSVSPPSENDASERAWACLRGLSHPKFVVSLHENTDWRRRSLDQWPGIFKWSRFLYQQRVAPDGESPAARDVLVIVTYLLHHILRLPDLPPTILKTKDLVELLTRLWTHKHADVYHSSSALERVLENCVAPQLDDVCKSVGSAQTAAKLVLERLKKATNAKEPNPNHMQCYTHLLINLARLPTHTLTMTILSEHAPWIVTRMLIVASELIGSNPKPDLYLQHCIYNGLVFLRYSLIREDSFKWVCEALDAGLLRVINDMSLVIGRMDHFHPKECVQHILRDTLPKHMIYKSVIKVMKREMEDMDPESVDRLVRKSFLKEAWMSLLLLTELRSNIAQLPKSLRRGGVGCENLQCSKWGKKTELRRCTGCHYVYFCSKECQIAAWPDHKAMCKLKGQQHSWKSQAQTQMLFYESDAQFFRELFGHDASVHLPHLRKLAKKRFPEESGENFVFCIDYTNPEYPAGTCSLKHIKTYKFQDYDGNEMNPDNTTQQNQEMINIVRRNPREYTFIEGSFVYGEHVFRRNLVMRPNLWVSNPEESEHDEPKWEQSRCANGPDEPGIFEMLAALDSPIDDIVKQFSELEMEELD